MLSSLEFGRICRFGFDRSAQSTSLMGETHFSGDCGGIGVAAGFAWSVVMFRGVVEIVYSPEVSLSHILSSFPSGGTRCGNDHRRHIRW